MACAAGFVDQCPIQLGDGCMSADKPRGRKPGTPGSLCGRPGVPRCPLLWSFYLVASRAWVGLCVPCFGIAHAPTRAVIRSWRSAAAVKEKGCMTS